MQKPRILAEAGEKVTQSKGGTNCLAKGDCAFKVRLKVALQRIDDICISGEQWRWFSV